MSVGLCRPRCSRFSSYRSSCMNYPVLNATLQHRRPLVLCSGFKQQMHPLQEPISSIRFEQGLQLLTKWKLQYGSCYVPKSASDAVELQQWISEVRKAGKSGYLSTKQQQQLDQAEFIWKQNVVDAKWHSNYHRLRCWLHDSHGSLQQLLQHGTDSSETLLESTSIAGLQAAGSAAAELQLQDGLALPTAQSSGGQLTTSQSQDQQQASGTPQPHNQQPQAHQQLLPEMHEVAVWLQRQIVLYNKLKLTPVKVHMLRQLGVKLKRQAGLTKPNLHPLLVGQNPDTFRRRPIVVTPATRRGKQVVADILRRHKEQLGQLQQQQQGQTTYSSSIPADSLQQGPVSPATSSTGPSISGANFPAVTTAASTAPPPDNGSSSGNSSSRAGASEPDRAFMFKLADLQRWKKKHGSCYVPLGVPDASDLAEWVQQVRALHGDAQGSSSCSAAPLQPQQQQQQHQHELQQLALWQLQELEAVGFVWRPKQDMEQWYAMYHQLRHFKQQHHHIMLPGRPRIQEASAVTGSSTSSGVDEAAANSSGNSSSGSGSSSGSSSSSGGGGNSSSSGAGGGAEWGSLAAWLQQQEVEYGAGRLSRMQEKLLKGLGWQPGR